MFESSKITKNGNICKHCALLYPAYSVTEIETIRQIIETNKSRDSVFKKDVEFYTTNKTDKTKRNLVIDTVNKMFSFREDSFHPFGMIYLYDEIKNYELTNTAGETIIKSRGGLGRAAVGAFAFGGAGAIVGASTAKKKMEVKNQQIEITISLKTHAGRRTEKIVGTPEILAFFDKVLDELEAEEEPEQAAPKQLTGNISTADELLKLKSLLDAGVLTQDEFDSQKQKLLN